MDVIEILKAFNNSFQGLKEPSWQNQGPKIDYQIYIICLPQKHDTKPNDEVDPKLIETNKPFVDTT